MFRSFIQTIFNLVVPPRQSELVVATIMLEDLYNLQTVDGLPYHSKEVAALVWELKYYANPHAASLSGQLLADELVMLASEEVGKPLLVPVPMHPKRRKERGHNQTEVLCEAVLEALRKNGSKNSLADVPVEGRPEDFFDSIFSYAPSVLVRKIATPQQQGLPKHKRLHNVDGSMEVVDKEKVKGRICIVVDDVTTTGATLSEAKRALKKAGARVVHTVALAYS